jgi:hypothetical protein
VLEGTRACELPKWKDGDQIDTLAAGCAEAGDFALAIKYQIQALNSKPPSSPGSRKQMQKHLRL